MAVAFRNLLTPVPRRAESLRSIVFGVLATATQYLLLGLQRHLFSRTCGEALSKLCASKPFRSNVWLTLLLGLALLSVAIKDYLLLPVLLSRPVQSNTETEHCCVSGLRDNLLARGATATRLAALNHYFQVEHMKVETFDASFHVPLVQTNDMRTPPNEELRAEKLFSDCSQVDLALASKRTKPNYVFFAALRVVTSVIFCFFIPVLVHEVSFLFLAVSLFSEATALYKRRFLGTISFFSALMLLLMSRAPWINAFSFLIIQGELLGQLSRRLLPWRVFLASEFAAAVLVVIGAVLLLVWRDFYVVESISATVNQILFNPRIPLSHVLLMCTLHGRSVFVYRRMSYSARKLTLLTSVAFLLVALVAFDKSNKLQ